MELMKIHQQNSVVINYMNFLMRYVKRLKTKTTTVLTTRNHAKEQDELVDKEFEHCNDFDDNASKQTLDTDLNYQLASWQKRNDETESMYDYDSNIETEDGIDSSACMLLLQITNMVMTIVCTKFGAMPIK